MDPAWMACTFAYAISEGINVLYALLEWNDAGAIEAPPVDGATLRKTMGMLEEAVREVLYGGRVVGAEFITEEDLARVVKLKELTADWPSTGALSPEVVTLAEACVSALCNGMSWREIRTYARR